MKNEEKLKYKIPETKVLPDFLAEKEPEWHKSLKAEKWWQKDNLKNINTEILDKEIVDTITAFKKLNEIMLKIGGSETCFIDWNENYKKLLERGYYRDGKSKMQKGQPCQCHRNVSRIYDARVEENDVVICTGFALTDDGMWRAHSWLLQRYLTRQGKIKTRIIETTAKRIAYFGFELTSTEANEFAELNS